MHMYTVHMYFHVGDMGWSEGGIYIVVGVRKMDGGRRVGGAKGVYRCEKWDGGWRMHGERYWCRCDEGGGGGCIMCRNQKMG